MWARDLVLHWAYCCAMTCFAADKAGHRAQILACAHSLALSGLDQSSFGFFFFVTFFEL
jgi:hypothetical protein